MEETKKELNQLFYPEVLPSDPATAIKELIIKTGEPVEVNPQNKNALARFILVFLYLMDEFFTGANLALYLWMDAPLPEIETDPEMAKTIKKLKQKRNNLCKSSSAAHGKFVNYVHYDEDTGAKLNPPKRELDTEAFNRACKELDEQIRHLESLKDNKEIEATVIANQKELTRLASAVFCAFEAEKISSPATSFIIQTANTEYFISFVKRVCSVLEADISENNEWTPKGHALGRFLLSLKERIKKVAILSDDSSVAKRITVLFDSVLSVEKFVHGANRAIVDRQNKAESQKAMEEFKDIFRSGFEKINTNLGLIEKGVIASNKQLAQIDGRLTDLLKIDGEILRATINNGHQLESLSGKLEDISSQISGLQEIMWSGMNK